MLKNINRSPVVFEYLDVLFFLQDYYKFRKAEESSFSYESWSHELEMNSRSFLRLMVIGKKKVSTNFVQSFSRLNFFTKSEEDYFELLVKYSQASNQKDKQAFGSNLLQILRKNTQQNDIPDFSDFVSSPLMPRLFTLLSFKDLNMVTRTLAELLDLPETDVLASLHKLQELELVTSEKVEDEIHWSSHSKKFKVQDKKGSVDLMKFHKQSLLEAIDAFHLPHELRRYKSLLLPMSPDELKLFYDAMDTFASEQFVRFSGDQYNGRRLFQINLNVHPVTKPLEKQTALPQDRFSEHPSPG